MGTLMEGFNPTNYVYKDVATHAKHLIATNRVVPISWSYAYWNVSTTCKCGVVGLLAFAFTNLYGILPADRPITYETPKKDEDPQILMDKIHKILEPLISIRQIKSVASSYDNINYFENHMSELDREYGQHYKKVYHSLISPGPTVLTHKILDNIIENGRFFLPEAEDREVFITF